MRASALNRFVRLLAALGLAGALLLPTLALPARAASPLVLRVGTTQDLDALNPYQTLLVSGYEVLRQWVKRRINLPFTLELQRQLLEVIWALEQTVNLRPALRVISTALRYIPTERLSFQFQSQFVFSL